MKKITIPQVYALLRRVARNIMLPLLIFYVLFCAVIFFIQEKIIFFPEQLSRDYEFSFHMPFEEMFFQRKEGVELNALLFQAEDSRGVVYFLHGNAGSLREWGYSAENFYQYDFDVFIPDYRGFGKSTGKLSEKALLNDANYLYDELQKLYDEEDIIIYGYSLGSAIAAYVASRNEPAMLVMESPFYNMKDLARRHYPYLPTFLVRYPFRTDQYIQEVKAPIRIIQGKDDEIVPYETSARLKGYLKNEDIFYTIPEGQHGNLFAFRYYHEILEEIFTEHLPIDSDDNN